MAKQPDGELALAIPKTGTINEAVQANAKFTEVRQPSCFGL
jgi:hypothetical protein